MNTRPDLNWGYLDLQSNAFDHSATGALIFLFERVVGNAPTPEVWKTPTHL